MEALRACWDRAALEAAVARPQTGYYQDVVEQAAALLESLAQNQAFIDGNKRTAIAVTAAFLRLNGYRLEFEDLETYAFMMALYKKGQFRFEKLEAWLRKHARRTL